MQYTAKKGQELYKTKAAAGLISVFVVITALLTVYFGFYARNHTSDPLDIRTMNNGSRIHKCQNRKAAEKLLLNCSTMHSLADYHSNIYGCISAVRVILNSEEINCA